MFLHHTMTDSEILRTCEGCTSPHLKLVSDRLRERVDTLRAVHRIADGAYLELVSGMADIRELSDVEH